MQNLFDGIEYVKQYALFEQAKSVYWYDIVTDSTVNTLIVGGRQNFEPYVTIIGDGFSLRYNGASLDLSCITSGNELDVIDDVNITEEWFFQQSTIKNFGSLQYEEIELVKEIYSRIYLK